MPSHSFSIAGIAERLSPLSLIFALVLAGACAFDEAALVDQPGPGAGPGGSAYSASLEALDQNAAVPELSISTLFLPAAQIGEPYAASVETSRSLGIGGQWSIESGALPAGLSASSTPSALVIGGTPASGQGPGVFPVVVTASSASGEQVTRAFVLYLNAAGLEVPSIEPKTAPAVVEGLYGETYVKAPSGVTFRIEAGELPAGLVAEPDDIWWQYTGKISGTPELGTFVQSPHRVVVSATKASTGAVGIGLVEVALAPHGAAPVDIEQGETIALEVDEDSHASDPFNRVKLSATDPDAEPASLDWSVTTAPAHGSAFVAAGSPSDSGGVVVVRYGPQPQFAGTDSFEVSVSDGFGNSDSITVEVTVSGHDNHFEWGALNGGAPVGTRGLDVFGWSGGVVAVALDDGSLVYSSRSRASGRYMGRLRADHRWQLWTPAGWSSSPDAMPQLVEHPTLSLQRSTWVPHPDHASGVIALSRRGFRVGASPLDVHGAPVHQVFDGTSWRMFDGGTSYSPVEHDPVIYTWNSVESDFAFDAESRTGMVVGLNGFAVTRFESQLTATKLGLDDAESAWRRWHRPAGQSGSWYSDSSYPSVNDREASRSTFVLDRAVSLTRYRYEHPQVAHSAGTSNFVVAALVSDLSAKTSRIVGARYHGATGTWQWWSDSGWQSAASATSFTAKLRNLFPGSDDSAFLDGISLPSGDVLFLISQGGAIHEVRYAAATQSFSAPVEIAAVVPATSSYRQFTAAVGPDGTTWLMLTDDGLRIRLYQRSLAGEWTGGQLIFATGETLSPEAIVFAGAQPVAFVAERTHGDQGRLYAIGDQPATFWSDEVPLELSDLPAPKQLSAGVFELDSDVDNSAPGFGYGASDALGLAVDDDGYSYNSHFGVCAVAVHPGDATSGQDAQGWGLFWDHFSFPLDLDLYPEGDKVLVIDRPITGGAGAVASGGRLSIWDMSGREQSFGFAVRSGEVPGNYVREYSPQQISLPMKWPSAVAVDRGAGVLYVASGLEDRIWVFDIANTVDSSAWFGRGGLVQRIDETHLALVDDMIDHLVAAGLLEASGGLVRWLSTDWSAVRQAALDDPLFPDLDSDDDDTDFLRNLMRTYKARRDLPVELFSFGGSGQGAGQFRNITGLSLASDGALLVVDSGNHRVQRLVVDLATHSAQAVQSIGSFGRGPGQLAWPVRASAAPSGQLFVSDPNNARIVVFEADGSFAYEFSSVDLGGSQRTVGDSKAVYAERPGLLYLSTGQRLLRLREAGGGG